MSEIKVITKTKKVQFSYKNKLYHYEYIATGSSGFSYIFIGKNKIYGPYVSDCTEEGREVYAAFKKANIKF